MKEHRTFTTPADLRNQPFITDALPTLCNRYGGRSVAQALMAKHMCMNLQGPTISANLVNRKEPPILCPIGCNVSNQVSNKVVPLECDFLNKRTNDDVVKLKLRAEIPYLTRKQVAEFKLPFYETLCHDLLENGYHYAFTELFEVHSLQLEQIKSAGPDSPIWNVPPLSEQPEKLHTMRDCLSEAEAAALRRDDHTLYSCYLKLALYFQKFPDDLWLTEHYLRYALSVAGRIKDDNKLKLALSYQYYGLAMQKKEDYVKSCSNLIEFYKLTRDQSWVNDDGIELAKLAEKYLVEIYLILVDNTDPKFSSEKINLCSKAYEIATSSGNWSLTAPTCLKMGHLLEEAGKLSEAITFYMGYFELSKNAGDYISIGKACKALAQLYKNKNELKEAIQYLQLFAQLSEEHHDWVELSNACQLLGQAYDDIGEHTEAVKWMTKAYDMPSFVQVSNTKPFEATKELSRIMIGVTKAHLMNVSFTNNLLKETKNAILRSIRWKSDPKSSNDLFSTKEIIRPAIRMSEFTPKRDVVRYSRHPADSFRYF